MVLAAGYADSWKARGRQAPGLTCCERADLLNTRQTFDQRIDFIFTRNLPDSGWAERDVIGDRPGDRTAGGLWPSDHGGVAATLLLAPAN